MFYMYMEVKYICGSVVLSKDPKVILGDFLTTTKKMAQKIYRKEYLPKLKNLKKNCFKN